MQEEREADRKDGRGEMEGEKRQCRKETKEGK
jgi:hypothetical protein